MNRIYLLVIVMLVAASTGFANIANPDLPGKKARSINTALSIRLDSGAKEARLVIPRSQLKQLRAELEQMDHDVDDTAAAGSVSTTQTIVSGVLLSLSFVFGGMWFIRNGPRKSKGVAAAAVLLACCSIASIVHANAGPPPEARSITGQMFSQSVHMYKGGWGDIKLEVSDKVSHPELIVPDPKKTADE